MEILAHRGLWCQPDEKNTLTALFKGLDEGYGLETDIRDLNGRLIISHDVSTHGSAIPLEQLLHYYTDGNFTSTLALNIKSDGLQKLLHDQLQKYAIKNYFIFDMSVPDTLGYFKWGMPTFIRRSDVEYYPKLMLSAQGIWLDELLTPWINTEVIISQTSIVGSVCIVSAELHGRSYNKQWEYITNALSVENLSNKLLICTDFPSYAKRHFT
ncbi:MAG: hypothetical protein HY939_02910 [Gammaproteobacteria bacterium]|nr:hypothetical protein [Gammaproteobacteria bacterium]